MKQNPKNVNWQSILESVRGKDSFEKTWKLGQPILRLMGAISPETAQSGQCAYDKLLEELKKANRSLDDLPKNTFLQYLSKAAASIGTDIFCEGRRQGYYVRKEEAIIDDGDEAESTLKRRGKEKLLYPVAERWLWAQSFRAAIIATKKRNGEWGNPDVVGVKVHEWFERRTLEIVTIECKNSLANWKRQIFEAVAHKRFADRSYFAFVLPVDEVEKRYKELVEFAAFYGVGLLVLEMGQKELKRYNEKDPTIARDLELLEFRVIYPAPKNHYLVQARMDFLNGLEWKTWKDLDCQTVNEAPETSVPDWGPVQPNKNGKKKREGVGAQSIKARGEKTHGQKKK